MKIADEKIEKINKNINELVELLDLIQNNGKTLYNADEDREYFIHTSETDRIEDLCCQLFIDGLTSIPNYANIEKMRARGYVVFAGERDSFGWLTGCVRKYGSRKILVFG